MKSSFFAVALLCPLVAFGDTLVMKNGVRFSGTFTRGNSETINFTEYNGNRQVLNMNDVQELRFGGQDEGSRNGNPEAAPAAAVVNGPAADPLDRLERDLRVAMDDSSISEDQRRAVRDSRETLRHAFQVSQTGQTPDRVAVRLALDNIRSAVNDPSVRGEDRERVLSDIDQTRSMLPGMNDDRFGRGRNY